MVYTAGIKRAVSNSTDYKKREDIRDRVMKVTEYDLEAGKIYGTDLTTNVAYEVYVDPIKKASAEKAILAKGNTATASKATWLGHAINKQMEKANPANKAYVILVKGKFIRKDATKNVVVIECEKIGGVPDSKPHKVIQGNIVTKYKLDKETGGKILYQAKSFDLKGYDINEENIEIIAKRIDAARANYGKKIGELQISEPTIGVQFRVMRKKAEANPYARDGQPTDLWETIEKSSLLDWIPGPKGEDGKEIKAQAHTLTGEEFKGAVEGMLEHINSSEKFKDGIESGNIEIDIQVFTNYPVSQNESARLTKNDPAKDKYADKNPLYQLSHGKSYCSEDHDQNGLLIGENYAVQGGILLLSADKWTEDEPPQRVPTNWVSRIHANNVRKHIDNMTPRQNGARVVVHPSLDIEKAISATNTAQAAPTPVQQTAAPAPVEQTPTFDPDFVGEMEGEDPFGSSFEESPKTGNRFGNR